MATYHHGESGEGWGGEQIEVSKVIGVPEIGCRLRWRCVERAEVKLQETG